MIYLDTRHCGFDLSRIGFPSVETCMAVVVETDDWLVGWHTPSTVSATVFDNNAVAFGAYARSMGPSPMRRIYGVTHRHRTPNRSQARSFVKGELRTVAQRLLYGGRASCVLLSVDRPDYVEFRRVGGGAKCEIWYQDSAAVAYTPGAVAPAATRHKSIVPAQNLPQPLYDAGTGTAPIVTGVVGATLIPLPGGDLKGFAVP